MQKAIGSLTTPIFTRLLSPAEYGQFSVFNSWMGVISIFVTLNLSAGIYTQGLIKYDSERDVFSSSLQGVTLTLTMFWGLVYFCFSDFWNQLFQFTSLQMLFMLVLIWLSAVFNFWASEQRVLYKYKTLVAVTMLVAFAQPVVGIIFVLLAEDKVTARIFSAICVEAVCYTGL
ncbi:MAG: hypothetical protein K6G63_08250, partial [Eubacterium sp.]|nr:hypothetical protein [Eubacterium sp.]